MVGFVPKSELAQLFKELQQHRGFELDAVALYYSRAAAAVDYEGSHLTYHKRVCINVRL